ncbi:DUF6973 domain-containing protein, partial [Croceivirga sp. JEA036]|uniref:DUF6973 domain-containing protein n=1 Tax=Croceivirga sp. JEA036 TaxID=2721162 RepID=UPI0016A2036D|nr:hypothetical protein [Croceivirga sp. JEA036]
SSYFTTETFSVCTDSGDDCNGCYYFDGTVTGGGGDPTMTGGSTGITSTPASEYDEDVVVTQPSGFQNMFVSLAETINEKLGNSLSPEELSFLVAFYDFAIEANQFLNGNNNSVEAKSIVKDIVDTLSRDILKEFEQDYRNRMSISEKAIFDSMSQFKQKGYLVNGQKATWAAEDLYPNSFYNGKGDAFRHAYFNALNAILLGVTLAKDLATAHEDKPAPSNYPNYSKEVQMDLFNNEVGRNKRTWFTDGFNSLVESISAAMVNGELRYLSHLLGGGSSGPATNQSQLIPTN